MKTEAVTEIFDKMGESYDEKNKVFAPISNNLHFLNGLLLKSLPENAKILCVGVGTGTEMEALAKAHPQWSFVGVEPSIGMIKEAEKRVANSRLSGRVELFHGYLSDYKTSVKFDAALCLLVAHFIRDLSDRKALFAGMSERLEPLGYMINAEISFDTSSSDYPKILKGWKAMHMLSGTSEEQLDKMLASLPEMLLILPPQKTEEVIASAGFSKPVQFFQSLLIHAWYAQKA